MIRCRLYRIELVGGKVIHVVMPARRSLYALSRSIDMSRVISVEPETWYAIWDGIEVPHYCP